MEHIDSVADEFRAFVGWLETNRASELVMLESVVNGIEGWLKVEFYLWLTAIRVPQLRPSQAYAEKDAGLEYRVKLDQRVRDIRKHVKQCDMWMRASSAPPLFHYVELKSVFREWNHGKMLDSAGDDLWYLKHMRDRHEQAATGNVIALAIGFDDDDWRDAKAHVLRRADMRPDHPVVEGAMGPTKRIRWVAITHAFSRGHS